MIDGRSAFSGLVIASDLIVLTAWRRLCEWQAAGVWERLHRELLRRL